MPVPYDNNHAADGFDSGADHTWRDVVPHDNNHAANGIDSGAGHTWCDVVPHDNNHAANGIHRIADEHLNCGAGGGSSGCDGAEEDTFNRVGECNRQVGSGLVMRSHWWVNMCAYSVSTFCGVVHVPLTAGARAVRLPP